MAEDLERRRVFRRQDGEARIVLQRPAKVHELAIAGGARSCPCRWRVGGTDARHQRFFSQPGRNLPGNLGRGDPAGRLAARAVRQGDLDGVHTSLAAVVSEAKPRSGETLTLADGSCQGQGRLNEGVCDMKVGVWAFSFFVLPVLAL